MTLLSPTAGPFFSKWKEGKESPPSFHLEKVRFITVNRKTMTEYFEYFSVKYIYCFFSGFMFRILSRQFTLELAIKCELFDTIEFMCKEVCVGNVDYCQNDNQRSQI